MAAIPMNAVAPTAPVPTITPPTSYANLVRTQRARNPCISNLETFLAETHPPLTCRIRVVDFKKPMSANAATTPNPTTAVQNPVTTTVRTVHDINLGTELRKITSQDLLGRLFLIEDLTSNVVQWLGSILEIDPLFFASHLDTPSQDIKFQAPDKATLPSRIKGKDYFNIHYHRTIVFTGELPDEYQSFTRQMIVHRKVTALTSIKERRIGLAQHCVSIYRTKLQGKGWIALILTDPKIDGRYKKPRSSLTISHPSELFAGGYEDFLSPHFANPVPATYNAPQTYRESLSDDLQYYFGAAGYGFDEQDPSLISLSRYPLRIVAREWVNYISVMSHSVKQYEYDSKNFKNKSIEIDLKELQRWRRRSMASEQKIEGCMRFIKYSRSTERKGNRAQWNEHLEDWIYVHNNLKSCGRTLEAMVDVTQIVDARRSVEETQETTKLTTLALVFVPMSLLASILSMNNDFAAGKKLFFVYWVTAVPVSAFLFLMMRPESVRKLLGRGKS